MTKFVNIFKKPYFLPILFSFSQFTKNLAVSQLHMDFYQYVKIFKKLMIQLQENAQTDRRYGRMDRSYQRGSCKLVFSGMNSIQSDRHAGFYIEFSDRTIQTSLLLKNNVETRV